MSGSQHVLDELSDYIDGESRDPDRIARHLQFCPECARRHLELRKLSAHLRALPGPEVHPAFATRVLATLAESPAPAPWFPLAFPRFAAAAIMTLLVGAGLWFARPDAPPKTTAPALNVAWRDDARVVEALAALLDTGAPVDLFGPSDDPSALEEMSEEDEFAWIPVDSILEVLADAAGTDDFVNPFEHDDLPGLLEIVVDETAPLPGGPVENLENEV